MPAARHPGAADFAPYLAVLTLDGYIEAVLVDLLEGDAGASAPRAGPRREIERRLGQGARPQLAAPFQGSDSRNHASGSRLTACRVQVNSKSKKSKLVKKASGLKFLHWSKEATNCLEIKEGNGTPGPIRTADLLLRRQTLKP